MYADENEAETLVITLRDDVQDVRVKLYYGVVKDLDVITRSVSVENHGQAPVQLERVMSLCLDQPYGDWDWMTFYGKHEMERTAFQNSAPPRRAVCRKSSRCIQPSVQPICNAGR